MRLRSMKNVPQIPGYRIERELGRGGMARVFQARDQKLGRRVALKVLFSYLAADRRVTRRFVKEARLAANLGHENIIRIFDVGQANDHFYFAMELLQCRSLKEQIRKAGRSGLATEPEKALDIVRQVAAALQYAHRAGVVHRDIKPENILFRDDGTPVLADFGIARVMDSGTRLTATGISVGSPHYMSPEQARGLQLDGRTDIYSLGVVLYEMLTGRVPYQAENTVAIVVKHIQEPVPRLPAALGRYQPLLERMMAKNPGARVAGAAALIQMIDELRPDSGMASSAAREAAAPQASALPAGRSPTAAFARTAFDRERKKLVLLAAVLLLLGALFLLQSLGWVFPVDLWHPLLAVLLGYVGALLVYLDVKVRQVDAMLQPQFKWSPRASKGVELIVFLGFVLIFAGLGVLLAAVLRLPYGYHWRFWPAAVILFLLRQLYLALKYR